MRFSRLATITAFLFGARPIWAETLLSTNQQSTSQTTERRLDEINKICNNYKKAKDVAKALEEATGHKGSTAYAKDMKMCARSLEEAVKININYNKPLYGRVNSQSSTDKILRNKINQAIALTYGAVAELDLLQKHINCQRAADNYGHSAEAATEIDSDYGEESYTPGKRFKVQFERKCPKVSLGRRDSSPKYE